MSTIAPRLVIAGITNLKDAETCVSIGVDAISLIFYDDPRQLTLEKAAEICNALPPLITLIGEFNDLPLERLKTIQRICRLSAVRMLGSENSDYVRRVNARMIRVIRLKPAGSPESESCVTVAADVFPDFNFYYRMKNDGKRFHLWKEAASALSKYPRSMVSGKIDQANLAEVLKLSPYAVRINSGAELFIGKKDPRIIEQIVKKVRS